MQISDINMERLPRHIAIIMDGNGRWAKKRGMLRTFGHKQGAKVVHEITETCARLGVEYLTLYAFSIENWNRPQEEIDTLMQLLVETIEKEVPTMMENNVRLLTIGDISRLPDTTRQRLQACIQQTAPNTGLTMVVALSYSARWEIVHAAQEIARQVQFGGLRPEDITEETVCQALCTKSMPDPDLLIRTSGELRISNFLLWQLAYSELYFTDCCWPDFNAEELYKAIVSYQQRERRFGKTSEQI